VLLNLVCWYFVEDFCIHVHQGYWPVVFFSCGVFVWLCYQRDRGLKNELGSVPFSSVLWFFVFFFEEFLKDCHQFFFKCLV